MSRFASASPQRTAVGLAIAAALAAGCAHVRPEAKPVRVEGLAPQSSARYQCGPSTLASVMTFHGSTVTEQDIADAIYSESARGTLLADMAWFAREHGFAARLFPGSLDDLRSAVEAGQPAVVLLDLGLLSIHKPHITAVTGITGDGVLLLGRRTAADYAPRGRFERQWKRAGNMVLLVTPR